MILRDPVTAYVALGANLGDARAAVLQAFEALASWPEIEVTGRSALYRHQRARAQHASCGARGVGVDQAFLGGALGVEGFEGVGGHVSVRCRAVEGSWFSPA